MKIACESKSCWAWKETQKGITKGTERWRCRVEGELMKMEDGWVREGGL